MKKNAFPGQRPPLAGQIGRFMQAEQGAMAPLMLGFFCMMILIGGIAVDVMRFETKRVAVQNTLDRATLAVANMTSAIVPDDIHTTPEERAHFIVEDHFIKANLEEYLQYVDFTSEFNYRIVEARAHVVSRNIFMKLLGVPILKTPSRSIAEQRITDIEIMLVLDVSGSMDGEKLRSLKVAAKEFIDQVKVSDSDNRISIGVIPYNAQVNLGDQLAAKFNLSNPHGVMNSNCVEIPIANNAGIAIFNALAMSRSTSMPLMTVADTESSSSASDAFFALSNTGNAAPTNNANQRWCNPSTTTEITLPTKDTATAKAGIDALQAQGNTSIVLGMRWATALLDPAARGIYQELIAEGQMDPGTEGMEGRPYDYNETNAEGQKALKVVVLMTDGQHVAHSRINDNYKTGTATITFSYTLTSGGSSRQRTATVWRATSGEFSVFYSHKLTGSTCSQRPFWVPSSGTWQSHPAGTTAAASGCYEPARTYTNAAPTRWETIWSTVRMNYAARQFFARALHPDDRSQGTDSNPSGNRTRVYDAVRGLVYGSYATAATMNTRLAANCAAARAAGIRVYGIAFQAPPAGQAAIESCTSVPTSTHYFDVTNTVGIRKAFRLIASNLSQLRLTQ